MDLTSNNTTPGDENYGVPDGLVNGTDLSYWGDQNARAFTPSGSGITTEEVNNPFGYAGYLNMDRDRYLARHRVYRSDLGRWMQRDPIGYVDGMSLYSYLDGRSVRTVDPTGLR